MKMNTLGLFKNKSRTSHQQKREDSADKERLSNFFINHFEEFFSLFHAVILA